MADIQDELNGIFETLATGAAGGGLAAIGGLTPQSTSIAAAVPAGAASSVLGSVLQTVTSAQSSSSTSSGVGGTLETIAKDVLKSGLGMVPIVSGLLSLFGGGGDSQPLPQLVKYQMPASIDYQAAEVGGQIENIDYSQSGTPRAFGGAYGDATVPGVTVNVQAMDARSFLDRSSDIAAAVKDAMLNLNSLNDVVNDL